MTTSKVMSVVLRVRHDRLHATPVGGRVMRFCWDRPGPTTCTIMRAIAIETDVQDKVPTGHDCQLSAPETLNKKLIIPGMRAPPGSSADFPV